MVVATAPSRAASTASSSSSSSSSALPTHEALRILLSPDGYYEYLGIPKPVTGGNSTTTTDNNNNNNNNNTFGWNSSNNNNNNNNTNNNNDYCSTTNDSSIDLEKVKKNYRRLSLKHHPDRPTGNAEAFRMLNRAKIVLSNSKLRREYDLLGLDLEDDADDDDADDDDDDDDEQNNNNKEDDDKYYCGGEENEKVKEGNNKRQEENEADNNRNVNEEDAAVEEKNCNKQQQQQQQQQQQHRRRHYHPTATNNGTSSANNCHTSAKHAKESNRTTTTTSSSSSSSSSNNNKRKSNGGGGGGTSAGGGGNKTETVMGHLASASLAAVLQVVVRTGLMGMVAVLISRYTVLSILAIGALASLSYKLYLSLKRTIGSTVKKMTWPIVKESLSPMIIALGIYCMYRGRRYVVIIPAIPDTIATTTIALDTTTTTTVETTYHNWSWTFWLGETIVMTSFLCNSSEKHTRGLVVGFGILSLLLSLWLRGKFWRYSFLLGLEAFFALLIVIIFPIMEMILESLVEEKMRKVGEKIRAHDKRMKELLRKEKGLS